MKRTMLALVAGMFFIVAAGATAAEDWPIRVHTLANGMRVVTLEDHSAPLVAVQIFYHVGSKDEQPGTTGFAHFFEHMMFRGSANVAPYEQMEMIYGVGGNINAATGSDFTFYEQTVPANALDLVLWMESDRLRGLRFDVEGFEAERQTVKEERRMRVDNQPYGRVLEVMLENAFTVHPYRWLPIGSMADLDAATVDDVRRFFETYYTPRNATMILVGDFDTADLLARVEKAFGDIPAGPEAPRVTAVEPVQTEERRATYYEDKAPLSGVIMGYKIPAYGHADSAALTMAGMLLSQGQSSRIYRSMVQEQKIALQALGLPDFREHPSLFYMIAIMNFGRQAEQGEEALESEIARLRNEAPSAEELEKLKNQIRSNEVLKMQSVNAKANAIGQKAILVGDPLAVNGDLDRFMAVTAEDIQRVARTYFTTANRTVLLIKPASMRPKEETPQAEEKTEGNHESN